MRNARHLLLASQNHTKKVAKKLNLENQDITNGRQYLLRTNKDIGMKFYLITEDQLENLGKKHDSLLKTGTLCDLMLDIAAHADDFQTFDAALEMANSELDRLELFFDTCDLV